MLGLFQRQKGGKPYEWKFIQRWCVESIDAFLKHAASDSNWEPYYKVRDRHGLDPMRLLASDEMVAEIATWVSNLIQEPSARRGKAQIDLLKRYQAALRKGRTPEETLKEFHRIER